MSETSHQPIVAKVWRNLSSPSMKSATGAGKVSVFQALVKSDQLLNFSGDLNVRREKGGSVKKAILGTLEDNAAHFPYLNGGITIVTKVLHTREASEGGVEVSFHREASIINGTQTQGALRTYHGWDDSTGDWDQSVEPVEVYCTVIETLNDDLITDIAVARNVQNMVKDVSVFGRQGAFDSLNAALAQAKSPIELSTSETDDAFETGKALQVMFAVMPESFWDKNMLIKRSRPSLYSSKAKWLKHFGKEMIDPTDSDKWDEVMRFMEEMIQPVLDLYLDSQVSSIWKVSHWRTDGVKVDASGNIRVVDDFLIPFMYAHSVFVKEKDGKWQLDLPGNYDPKLFVAKIKKLTTPYGSDSSNPNFFGKQESSYEILQLVAESMG